MDINEKVFAAFEVEHKEQLEGIRALLADLTGDDVAAGDGRLEEAFRLAHTLKGGARVCDLRAPEMLGHHLETLFSELRQGNIRLDHDVAKVVHLVLDTIEDWMTALVAQETLPEPDAAISAIQRVLAPKEKDASPGSVPNELRHRLLEAFASEHIEYLAGLRTILDRWHGNLPSAGDADVREAFRMAHSLRGAAQLVDMPNVALLGDQLETLIGGVRQGRQEADAAFVEKARQLLTAVEAATRNKVPANDASETDKQPHATPKVAAEDIHPTSKKPSDRRTDAAVDTAPANLPIEMVRVSSESLDRLVRSSGQLVGESLRYEAIRGAMAQLQDKLDQFEAEREAIRKSAAGDLHRLTAQPQFRRVARFYYDLDRQLRMIGRSARRVSRLHETASLHLRARSEEVHRSAREARMVPVDGVFQGFRKMVRDLARDQGKQVEFLVSGFQQKADRLVLQSLKDPVMHILRNAVVHGIESPEERTARNKSETGRVTLSIDVLGNRLRLCVDDDGRGIDYQRVAEATASIDPASSSAVSERPLEELAKCIFQPGVSTVSEVSELAGRGMGLSVVQQAARRLKGEAQVCPKQGPGTCIEVSVPLSVSTHRLLCVLCRKQVFAVPVSDVERLLRIPTAEVSTVEGRPVVWFQRQPIPLVGLAELLGMADPTFTVAGSHVCAAVFRAGGRRIAVGVDMLLEEKESLIQELTGPAAFVTRFAGAILNEDGTAALVLNSSELVGGATKSRQLPVMAEAVGPQECSSKRVLVVDDSFTTRTLEKSILESHGYDVRIAVDGVEAMALLRSEAVDVVICDVEMPRMDGFQLLTEVKQDVRLRSLPFVLVTSRDRREDQERGLSLGADAYIIKQKFDHRELLTAIEQVV